MRLKSTLGITGSLFACLTIGIASAPEAAALDYETDHAVYTTVNPDYTADGWWFQGAGSNGYGGGISAFNSNGDNWWVLDDLVDGKSVAVKWKNWRNGGLYRQGVCINSHSAPSWAVCNKNFYEDSTLTAETCLYDGDTGKYSDCDEFGWEFRVSDGKTV
ncbi:hypothetical protein ACFWBB_39100 [Streptomyces sp. NPDC060000]|uniref:hypothetical protein n=1 Tax=Streptomyces sp. NPDC060000 TaxID=3347031 RepID=UPI0036C77078